MSDDLLFMPTLVDLTKTEDAKALLDFIKSDAVGHFSVGGQIRNRGKGNFYMVIEFHSTPFAPKQVSTVTADTKDQLRKYKELLQVYDKSATGGVWQPVDDKKTLWFDMEVDAIDLSQIENVGQGRMFVPPGTGKKK